MTSPTLHVDKNGYRDIPYSTAKVKEYSKHSLRDRIQLFFLQRFTEMQRLELARDEHEISTVVYLKKKDAKKMAEAGTREVEKILDYQAGDMIQDSTEVSSRNISARYVDHYKTSNKVMLFFMNLFNRDKWVKAGDLWMKNRGQLYIKKSEYYDWSNIEFSKAQNGIQARQVRP